MESCRDCPLTCGVQKLWEKSQCGRLLTHGAHKLQGKSWGGYPLVCGALWWLSLMNEGCQESMENNGLMALLLYQNEPFVIGLALLLGVCMSAPVYESKSCCLSLILTLVRGSW